MTQPVIHLEISQGFLCMFFHSFIWLRLLFSCRIIIRAIDFAYKNGWNHICCSCIFTGPFMLPDKLRTKRPNCLPNYMMFVRLWQPGSKLYGNYRTLLMVLLGGFLLLWKPTVFHIVISESSMPTFADKIKKIKIKDRDLLFSKRIRL